MGSNPVRRLWTFALGALVVLGVAAPGASAADYDVAPNLLSGVIRTLPDPAAPPAGANDFSCRPSAAHPYPLVLVPGTFSTMGDDFAALAPTLANAGYCVFALNYGYVHPDDLIQAVGPVPTSAQQLAAFVNRVRSATGVARVDLVGHSQGGMLAEYYAKLLGGAPKVHRIVGLSPTTHGTTLVGLTNLAHALPLLNAAVGSACRACYDQEIGSDVIRRLDAGPIAQPGVQYTVIETRFEAVVTPVGSAFIREPGVTNRYVQDSCLNDLTGHVNLVYDQVTFRLVMNALSPGTARSPQCFKAFPFPAG